MNKKPPVVQRQRKSKDELDAGDRRRQKKYYHGPAGQKYAKAYRESGKARAASRRWAKSEVGKKVNRDYQAKMRLDALIKKTGSTKCEVCGAPAEPGKRFLAHHVDYENNVVVLLCFQCHIWLHGQAHVWWHPMKNQHGKDRGPYEFAKAVVAMYQRTLEIKK